MEASDGTLLSDLKDFLGLTVRREATESGRSASSPKRDRYSGFATSAAVNLAQGEGDVRFEPGLLHKVEKELVLTL